MITAVVPVRKGSVRVKNKNMRAFAGSNLLQIKLNTLKAVGLFDNIVVSTDSEAMMEVAQKAGVDIHRRDPYYASSKCNNSEFFENIAQSIESDIIAYTPVTSPLVSRETYREVYTAISYVFPIKKINKSLWSFVNTLINCFLKFNFSFYYPFCHILLKII